MSPTSSSPDDPFGRPSASVPIPDRRVVRAFAFDPMSTRLSGRFLHISIPFEEGLAPGPSGELARVIDVDHTRSTWYRPVDLNDPYVLAQQGLRPSESDPRTHQQIVYAVTMSVIERFERFGGRRFRWIGKKRLTLVPHAFEGRNAFFDPDHGAVLFGYYRASAEDPGANLPGQLMFTCLSVDIIAHEVTHAIVHRIRPQYQHATNADVFAWHEAFADLVALFHHFLFREVVADAIAGSEGELGSAGALFDLAAEFGESTGRGRALRSAIGAPHTPDAFLQAKEPHERGAFFVAAVFDAFLEIYKARIAGLRRLATGGSGILPPGALPPDLVALASLEAVRCADRMLGLVVRAFEFLPVVDVTFGDVVKAIVTADRALYPDDELRLRSTLVEALRRRGIRPVGVASLAEESLTCERPTIDLNLTEEPAAADLSRLILDATRRLDVSKRTSHTPAADEDGQGTPTPDPAFIGTNPYGAGTNPYQADDDDDDEGAPDDPIAADLHEWAAYHAVAIGLDPEVKLRVAGYHVAYLRAADGQARPVVVVQLLQRRKDLEDPVAEGEKPVRMNAGTTVIARVDGEVLYLVTKPLPASKPEGLAAHAAEVGIPVAIAEKWDAEGQTRLAEIREWLEGVTNDDPLSAWTTQPAVQRMTFARLHGSFPEAEDEPEERPDAREELRKVALDAVLSDAAVERLRDALLRAGGE